MEIEREAAFEAARDIRAPTLPRAPLREHADPRQVVVVAELLEQQVRERRGRLADGKPRMPPALDEDDALAAPAQGERHERPGKPGADNRDVRVNPHEPPTDPAES